MSRMTKGRAEAQQVDTFSESEHGSHRRLRVSRPRPEQFTRAFVDALRDILHDEIRAAG
jgi:hypothetical protein